MSTTSSVTLGDVTITEDDVRLLRPPNWLNDQLLSLWVELLRRTKSPTDDNGDNMGDDTVAIIPPNLAFFIMLAGEDDVSASLKSLNLPTKRGIVLFINDSTGDTHGSHWSVLCYHRQLDQFRTYDSGGDMNRTVSRKMANILVKHLGTSRATVTLEHVKIPQQKNSYACGDFSCAVAHKIVTCNSGTTKDGDNNTKKNNNTEMEIDFEDLQAVADTVRPKLRAAINALRSGTAINIDIDNNWVRKKRTRDADDIGTE